MSKIVFIITDYGSFNNFLGEAAIALASKGYEITVICSRTRVIDVPDKVDYESLGIVFHYVAFPRGFNLFKHYKSSVEIHKIVNRIKPDILSIHFTTGIFTSTFIGRFKFKTIGTFHGLGYPVVEGMLKRFMYKAIEKRSIERLDEAWVLNESDHNLLLKDFPEKSVLLLPTKGLGCDLKKFDPSLFSINSKSALKHDLHIEVNDFNICFTGRFTNFKGFDKVIKAFKKVREEYGKTNINLILIGGKDSAHSTGLDKTDEDWYISESSIKKIGFTSEVEKYLSITDLFVFPSEKEGMPICITEALAMEVPVITANSRGCNDLIENSINGFLLEENTPEEIAKQIVRLVATPNILGELSRNIIEKRSLLDRQQFVDQQLKYFASL